jgi:hypothetical protein
MDGRVVPMVETEEKGNKLRKSRGGDKHRRKVGIGIKALRKCPPLFRRIRKIEKKKNHQ